MVLAVACSPRAGERRAAPPTIVRPVPTIVTVPVLAGAGPAITAVRFGEETAVTIVNFGSESVDLRRWLLCSRSDCFGLAGRLGPGRMKVVAPPEIHRLAADGGDLALYASTRYDDHDHLADYVAWGAGGPRLQPAVAGGLWPQGDAVPVGPGAVSISAPAGGSSSADWVEEDG